MKKLDWKHVATFVILALSMALAPVFRAQDLGSITRITTVPDGAQYVVDGQNYSQASSAVWPTSCKHALWVPNTVQASQIIRTQYIFRNWEFAGGTFQFNPVTEIGRASCRERV